MAPQHCEACGKNRVEKGRDVMAALSAQRRAFAQEQTQP